MVTDWKEVPVNLVPDDIWRKKIMPIGRKAVYDLCNRPGFPCLKVGKKFIINRDLLRQWLEDQSLKKDA